MHDTAIYFVLICLFYGNYAVNNNLAGKILPAAGLYFWLVTLAVGDENSITLPCDRHIILLAATADGENETCALATETYDNIKNRQFTFKMNSKDKILYESEKTFIRINDKRNFFTARNK